MTTFRYFLNLRYKRKQQRKKIRKAIKSNLYLKKYSLSGGRYIKKTMYLATEKIYIDKAKIKHTNDLAVITLFIYNPIKNKIMEASLEISMWSYNIGGKLTEIGVTQLEELYIQMKKLYTHSKLRIADKKVKYGLRMRTRKYFWKIHPTLLKIVKSYLLIYNLNLKFFSVFLPFGHQKNNTKPLLRISNPKLTLYNHYFRDYSDGISMDLNSFRIKKNNIVLKAKAMRRIMFMYNKHNRFIKFLMLNDKKFELRFLENLRRIASTMYKKSVKLNIVNLNKYYLNSNIYTQIVSLKLRDRRFSAYNTLKGSLSNINIDRIRVPRYKLDIDPKTILVNKMNKHIFDVLPQKLENESWLDDIVFNNRVLENPLSLFTQEQIFRAKKVDKFMRRVFKTIKHKKLAGIRVTAKGRLTKRFKASRSLSKLMWIGGLRNIESSYQGLSAQMLRGHCISNVEYSVTNNKRRIGSYGVKSWISSM